MFFPIQKKSDLEPLLKFQPQTKENIALDFPIYLAINEIDFQNQNINDQEYTLHDYLTHELGLNLFSEIKNQNTVTMTFGFQERNENFDINVTKPISKQIESLIARWNQFTFELAI